jgi:hypothetical protein
MIITQDILRRDTVRLIKQIDAQIKEVEEEAQRAGIPPEKLRDSHNNWVMSPLLMAKAQAYNTLVLLQTGK